MDMFEHCRVARDDDWSTRVFVRAYDDAVIEKYPGNIPDTEQPIGYVLEIDHSVEREDPPRTALWKMPAEHREHPENPLQTAVRSILGELGLEVDPGRFSYTGTQRSGNRTHWLILFTADIGMKQLAQLNPFHRENEGEESKFFLVNEFGTLVRNRQFLLPHLRVLESNRVYVRQPAQT